MRFRVGLPDLLPPEMTLPLPRRRRSGRTEVACVPPSQPQAGTCNHSTAELLCSLALPLSFVSSPPFQEVRGPGGPSLSPPASGLLLSQSRVPAPRGDGRPGAGLRAAVSASVSVAAGLRTWTPWASGGLAGDIGEPEESGGARGPRPAPGPRSRGQAAGAAVGDSSACGSWARLPTARLRNIRGPPGVRAPLAGVAGWCSSGRRTSLRGETVAGQGGGRLLEPDLQPGHAPAALPDGSRGGTRRPGRVRPGAAPAALPSPLPGAERQRDGLGPGPCSSPGTASSPGSSTARTLLDPPASGAGSRPSSQRGPTSIGGRLSHTRDLLALEWGCRRRVQPGPRPSGAGDPWGEQPSHRQQHLHRSCPTPQPPGPTCLMESRGEKSEEADGVRVTPQLLKARSGEFSLESILLLKLRGLGLVDLGCLGDCLGLEWLDLSGNALTQLGPLASLRQLAVLNVADNRLTGLEPLAACENLQHLNAAGNLLAGPAQLQCLAGLRGLERLRLRDPLARLSNPLCASPCYWASVRELLPGLKVLDGERVSGRGSDFYQLCRDLDSSLRPGPGTPGPRPAEAQPWVEPSYWEAWPPRSSSILEEACRQFQDTLRECHDLDRQARDSLAQAERVLSPAGAAAASFIF